MVENVYQIEVQGIYSETVNDRSTDLTATQLSKSAQILYTCAMKTAASFDLHHI